MKRLIITIDGPAGAGKSSVAKFLAQKLDYLYIDSGAIYRAFALAACESGIDPEDEEAIENFCRAGGLSFLWDKDEFRSFYHGEEVTDKIRTEAVGDLASIFSTRPQVRQHLTGLQRELGEEGGVVLEGRDAGTVVFPQADLKFFLDASLEIRAQRRREELAQMGREAPISEVLEDLVRRDIRDKGRAIAPLMVPPGGIVIDTTHLTIPQVVDEILGYIAGR